MHRRRPQPLSAKETEELQTLRALHTFFTQHKPIWQVVHDKFFAARSSHVKAVTYKTEPGTREHDKEIARVQACDEVILMPKTTEARLNVLAKKEATYNAYKETQSARA